MRGKSNGKSRHKRTETPENILQETTLLSTIALDEASIMSSFPAARPSKQRRHRAPAVPYHKAASPY